MQLVGAVLSLTYNCHVRLSILELLNHRAKGDFLMEIKRHLNLNGFLHVQLANRLALAGIEANKGLSE